LKKNDDSGLTCDKHPGNRFQRRILEWNQREHERKIRRKITGRMDVWMGLRRRMTDCGLTEEEAE
jgi:hypothetical protein